MKCDVMWCEVMSSDEKESERESARTQSFEMKMEISHK